MSDIILWPVGDSPEMRVPGEFAAPPAAAVASGRMSLLRAALHPSRRHKGYGILDVKHVEEQERILQAIFDDEELLIELIEL